ncbi:unnamed protein product, partial [marine sediment metagenome]
LENIPFLEEEKRLISDIGVRLKDFLIKKESESLIMEENMKLLELSKIRKELVTRISHELKTPLNSVLSASYHLLNFYGDKMEPDITNFFKIIFKGGERLKILINNLLDISRIESGKFELKLEKIDLIEIISECVNDITFFARNREISLNVNLPNEFIFKVNIIKIEQVITNLLSNAIKNTPPKGEVYITFQKNIHYIDIQIKDTGIGLTEEEKKKLFKKFGKIERYGKKFDVDIEGSGLGLYISKNIIELHGGQVLVESDGRNKGSTFIIRLIKER